MTKNCDRSTHPLSEEEKKIHIPPPLLWLWKKELPYPGRFKKKKKKKKLPLPATKTKYPRVQTSQIKPILFFLSSQCIDTHLSLSHTHTHNLFKRISFVHNHATHCKKELFLLDLFSITENLKKALKLNVPQILKDLL